jgi:hypothetical protein
LEISDIALIFVAKHSDMKRLLLVSILFAIFSIHVSGQFKGGLKGGLNVNDFIVTNTDGLFKNETFSTRVSYHIGSYVQQSFSDRLAWQIEVLFSNKGYIHKMEDQNIGISLNYINWPLLFVYKPIKTVELEIGPELGYLISGEPFLKSFDVGIDIGARFNISKKFLAGLRYSNGFPFKMNLEEAEAQGIYPRYQNSVLQIYIGYNLISEILGSDEK